MTSVSPLLADIFLLRGYCGPPPPPEPSLDEGGGGVDELPEIKVRLGMSCVIFEIQGTCKISFIGYMEMVLIMDVWKKTLKPNDASNYLFLK